MSPSILGSVTLGYEPIWNHWRKRAGVRLLVDVEAGTQVDARHFLDAIAEQGSGISGTRQPLLLSVRSHALLQDLLEHPLSPSIWIEIQNDWLGDTRLVAKVRAARQRGLQLVWRGEPGQTPGADVKGLFHKTLRTLTPQEALSALRSSARQRHTHGTGSNFTTGSPIVAGSLYEGLASPALVEHALDRQDAWGVVGWPADEVLHGYRFKQIQPARHLVLALVQAIDADESMENIEQRMGDEPLLNYRFLRFANSAGGSLQRDVDSVRKGLMAMGYARVRAWLMEQLPQASNDPNLDPLRSSMVLRARIMERLSNAGLEGDLRREVFTCGIFSQMDLLVGEPLGATIHRLPLPGRVASAIVGQSGPYAPWLEVASALESGCTRVIREVCKAHKIATEEVNRALLRTLAVA
jgi:hypothetical protein